MPSGAYGTSNVNILSSRIVSIDQYSSSLLDTQKMKTVFCRFISPLVAQTTAVSVKKRIYLWHCNVF